MLKPSPVLCHGSRLSWETGQLAAFQRGRQRGNIMLGGCGGIPQSPVVLACLETGDRGTEMTLCGRDENDGIR